MLKKLGDFLKIRSHKKKYDWYFTNGEAGKENELISASNLSEPISSPSTSNLSKEIPLSTNPLSTEGSQSKIKLPDFTPLLNAPEKETEAFNPEEEIEKILLPRLFKGILNPDEADKYRLIIRNLKSRGIKITDDLNYLIESLSRHKFDILSIETSQFSASSMLCQKC